MSRRDNLNYVCSKSTGIWLLGWNRNLVAFVAAYVAEVIFSDED